MEQKIYQHRKKTLFLTRDWAIVKDQPGPAELIWIGC